MKKSLLSIVTGAVLLAGAGLASAQTTTTTTWTDAHGNIIREHSTTANVKPFMDPSFKVTVGTPLPQTAELYPLPPTITVPERDNFSYTIVNNTPVIVERDSRRIVHMWGGPRD
jgi:hypothetical protein